MNGLMMMMMMMSMVVIFRDAIIETRNQGIQVPVG